MFQFISRCIPLLGLAVAYGCAPSGDASTQSPSALQPVVDSSAEVSAFSLDDTKQIIYLDTQLAPGQRRRFDIGLGSITIQTLRVTDKKLTFHYTPEVEGGYTIYECTVPVSTTRVEFRINSDGTPGKTSFDLTKCKLVRRGNVHLETTPQ
jgi:hypothetical protein